MRRNGQTRDADAVRYCQHCNGWTGHEMQQTGEYRCQVCSRDDQPAEPEPDVPSGREQPERPERL